LDTLAILFFLTISKKISVFRRFSLCGKWQAANQAKTGKIMPVVFRVNNFTKAFFRQPLMKKTPWRAVIPKVMDPSFLLAACLAWRIPPIWVFTVPAGNLRNFYHFPAS
jgi:hypothetical protein